MCWPPHITLSERHYTHTSCGRTSQVALVVKNPPANAGDRRDKGSIPGSGRSPGEGHGNPLQYSFLENPVDRGAWRATIHRVVKSGTRLKQLSTHTWGRAGRWFPGLGPQGVPEDPPLQTEHKGPGYSTRSLTTLSAVLFSELSARTALLLPLLSPRNLH